MGGAPPPRLGDAPQGLKNVEKRHFFHRFWGLRIKPEGGVGGDSPLPVQAERGGRSESEEAPR